MTTKQDKKPASFINVGDLIKKLPSIEHYEVDAASYYSLESALNRVVRLLIRKYCFDKGKKQSEISEKRKEKLASRLKREFLRKEEKEKDQLKIIFDFTPIPMGDYITLKHINGDIISVYELSHIQSAIADHCIKLDLKPRNLYSCTVIRKLNDLYDVIDFKPL